MNIETSSINRTQKVELTPSAINKNNSSVNFAEELKDYKKEKETPKEVEAKDSPKEKEAQKEVEPEESKESKATEEKELKEAIEDMNSIVKEFNQTDENSEDAVKNDANLSDKNNVINKDFNIQDKQDLLPQMNPNMNFSGDGQPFSSFMNNDSNQKPTNPNNILGTSAQDLAEEAAILSTMAENIALANKNQLVNDSKTITNNEGVKRVSTHNDITIENIVKFDSIIMNQADVEVFANLVKKGEINLNNLAPKSAEQAVHVSKTLADMIAQSMEKNQPLRIDFDNNISVIIRISRDGKISADFLPSSQVAEAYLKENLPLLKQRFDDNDIKYDSLNQRERREQKESNKKKDRNNE